jgi:methylmalonyl-CoA mutase N-terminal domain/subunit
MRDQFGARNARSLLLRFHTQTAGSTLTAQQPLNNVVRVALQALSAVLGGTQSLHTNAFDEALALPTEASARLALRTQQIIAEETGVPDVADPLGGSYLIEYLTDSIVSGARDLMARIEEMGGAVTAIEDGFMQEQIEEAAYSFQKGVDRRDRIIVGVNEYTVDEEEVVETLVADPALEEAQRKRLERLRRERDNDAVPKALHRLEEEARGAGNLLYPMREAHAALATIGEVSNALRRVFSTYEPGSDT